MKKGITPVIAMILLILIVVALGGVFATWSMTSVEDLQNSTAGHISEMSSRLRRSIAIDNVDPASDEIYIRNVGTETIALASLAQIGAYSDNEWCSPTWAHINATATEFAPNDMAFATCGVATTGNEVRVTIGSGDDLEAVDTYDVP